MFVGYLSIDERYTKYIIAFLKNKYNFNLKESLSIIFHLGCDFFCENNGALRFSPKIYIDKMVQTYVTIFGSKPNKYVESYLGQGYCVDIDTPELQCNEYTHKY